MIKNDKWLPTSVQDIKNSFTFSAKEVLKKNIAYNIQFLQYLHRNIAEEETTTVLYRIRYKMFIINAMSIIEAVFIALLNERNLIPLEEWKDGTHHHQTINDSLIEVYYNRHKVQPYKKKIKFDEALHLIQKNKVLKFNDSSVSVIKELQNLRNHLHLDKANNSFDSDYNKFDEKSFFITKMVFYYILKNKKVSSNTDYIEFLRPTVTDYNKYILNN